MELLSVTAITYIPQENRITRKHVEYRKATVKGKTGETETAEVYPLQLTVSERSARLPE